MTALVLLVAFVAAFGLLPPGQFSLVLLGIVALAAFEWGRLCLPGRAPFAAAYAALVVAVAFWIQHEAVLVKPVVYSGLVFWCASPVILSFWAGRGSVPPAALLIGVLALLPAFLSLSVLLSMLDGQGDYLWVLLVTVWAADSAAYFTGRAIGRRKLAPRISPGKTWEGAVGGLAGAALIGYLLARVLSIGEIHSAAAWIAVCAIAAAFSILGDLTESLLKRMARVKDSGALLPGHGGVLDRVDGILAAAPVFTALLWLLGTPGGVTT